MHDKVWLVGLALGVALLSGCREPYREQGWATRHITDAYTFPARDWDTGEVIAEGQTVAASELEKGRQEYMHYCYACHGVHGDGRGPAARGLRPPPRDFRLGKFKFGAVRSGQKPNDWDFLRIVQGGLHGTAMLEWNITDEEVLRIVQFIKTFPQLYCDERTMNHWQKEWPADCQAWAKQNADENGVLNDEAVQTLRDNKGVIKPSSWLDTYTSGKKKGQLRETGEPVLVTEDPWQGRVSEAVEKGKELYHLSKQCVTCHPAYVTRQEFSDLSLKVEGAAKTSFRDFLYTPEVKDSDYGVKVMPPDFTLNPLRSIRTDHELEDLFRVIGSGVGGTAMTSWIDGATNEELWALVHYIKSLKDLYLHENRQRRNELAERLAKQAPLAPPPPAAPPPAEPPPDKPEEEAPADASAAPADSAAPSAVPSGSAAPKEAPKDKPKEAPKDKPKEAPKDKGKAPPAPPKAPPKGKSKDADIYP